MFVVYASNFISNNRPIAAFSEDGLELQAFLEMTGLDQEDRNEVVQELVVDELKNYMSLGLKLYLIETDGEDYWRIDELSDTLDEYMSYAPDEFKRVDSYEVTNILETYFLVGSVWAIDKEYAEKKFRWILEEITKNNRRVDGYMYQSTWPYQKTIGGDFD